MAASRFQIRTPYHPEFVVQAHKLDGRWKKRSGMWSFDCSKYKEVARIVNKMFDVHLPIAGEESNEQTATQAD